MKLLAPIINVKVAYNGKIGIMLDFPLFATSGGSVMKCASLFVNRKDKQF